MKDETHGAAVRFENVSKWFGQQVVLRNISFEVPRGDALCILGRSGTGKSVSLKIAMRLLKPDSGKVLIEGSDITRLEGADLANVRKKMGFLFQDAALFDWLSVAENLAFPLRRHTRKPEPEIAAAVEQGLAQVGLQNDGDKMPSELSGGMRKRAGIARALMLDPRILLIDEPDSGLDRITAAEIDHLLAGLNKQNHKTLLVVTHDPVGARRYSNRMAVLDRTNLTALGTAEELERSSDQTVRSLVSIEEK